MLVESKERRMMRIIKKRLTIFGLKDTTNIIHSKISYKEGDIVFIGDYYEDYPHSYIVEEDSIHDFSRNDKWWYETKVRRLTEFEFMILKACGRTSLERKPNGKLKYRKNSTKYDAKKFISGVIDER